MLKLRVRAQLGNQMFQYAAVRSAAERRGLGFVWEEGIAWKDWVRRRVGRKTMTRAVQLPDYFTLGGDGRVRNFCRQLRWHVGARRRARTYTPPYREAAPGYYVETFDPGLGAVPDWAVVIGWLQSQRYFADRSGQVREWFRLRDRWQRRVDAVEARLPGTPETRCAVHVRRTDFATADPLDPVNGWLLPLSYYDLSFSMMPPGLSYVVVSDEPDWAERQLYFLPRMYVSRGEAGVVDMALLGRCRYNIIANSTFSWWGAWLNPRPDKVVVAPDFFNGWKRGFWDPEEIRVDGWQYVRIPWPAAAVGSSPPVPTEPTVI